MQRVECVELEDSGLCDRTMRKPQAKSLTKKMIGLVEHSKAGGGSHFIITDPGDNDRGYGAQPRISSIRELDYLVRFTVTSERFT